MNILNGQTDFKLRIEGSAIRETILVFLVIFILILLSALRKMTMASPMELLRSEHTGEKPPKGNWLLALLGVCHCLWPGGNNRRPDCGFDMVFCCGYSCYRSNVYAFYCWISNPLPDFAEE